MTSKDFRGSTNPFGVPCQRMKKGTAVIVSIPLPNKEWMDVRGVVTLEPWWNNGAKTAYLQVRVEKQLTHTDTHNYSGVFAVYFDAVKEVLE